MIVHGYTVTPKQIAAAEAAIAAGLDHEAVSDALWAAGMPERWGSVFLPEETATRLMAARRPRPAPTQMEPWEGVGRPALAVA